MSERSHPSAVRRALLSVLPVVLIGACGSAATDPGVLRIYTSVTQDTVDAVVASYRATDPDTEIEVFRAPTGELTARIAAESREGGIQADVVWMSDPLSIGQYERDGLLREWSPATIDAVPAEYRTSSFFGTRLLNLVIVASVDLVDPPSDWDDLPLVDGAVAIPDPGFAGSAFAALGYFALSPQYGMAYYRDLAEAGAVQVRSPGDVVSGVAEGLYPAGISLARTVRSAAEDGSPVTLVWPRSGAIAIYSPIAVIDSSTSDAAEPFVSHVLGVDAQAAIAETGWEPIRDDVEWADSGPQVGVDWTTAFDRSEMLLDEYQAVFGTPDP